MGKVKKSKDFKKQKQQTISSVSEEVPVDSKENVIQTIIDQLQAVNVEEKCCGLQTFAIMIENQENIRQFIDQGLVKIAAPLLLDAASSVRNSAAGVLRNLSVAGFEICDALMEQDVMTPLTCYFHEHLDKWTPDLNSKSKDEDSDTFIQSINLLCNLCESSELAIKYMGQSRILDIVPRYLDLAVFSSDIVIAVLQCLFVVVEDNPLASEKVKANAETQLQQIIKLEGNDPSILLMKTLAAGVIVNTCGGNVINLPVQIISGIVSILANTLAVDHRLAANQLSSNVPLVNASGKVNAPKGKEAHLLENQIKSVSHLLDAQQSAVEIVANICSCEDVDDTVEDDDSIDSDEMADEDVCHKGDSVLAEDKLPPEVLESLTSLQLFDKVWARAQLPAENIMLIFKEYEGTQAVYKKFYNLQSRSLLCVNNMLSSLPIESFGDVNGVYKIWIDAGKLVFKQKSDDVNLLESATAVMRAALDKIKFRENGNTSGSGLFHDLALSDIEMMLSGIRDCGVPEIRSNLIRMIGILALLLVQNLTETATEVVCTITDFLLEQAHKETEVWVLAEAIDTLVDLYSEDETDTLAAKVKLVDKLMTLAPILKNKARQQKKLPNEYKVLVNTATSNLPRFIRYKKGRLNKL